MLNYSKIIELNQREKIKLVTKNNQLQQGISSKRDLLIQWLISSTFQNKISLKTIELAVLYIDNYLQSQTIQDSNLQLLAISAFNLAAKFNQKGMLQQTKIMSPNGVNMYQDIDYDNMEVELLQKMQYQLNFITSSDYAELLGLNLQDERIKSYFLFILLDQNIYQFKHLELALAISLLSDNQNLQFQPKIHKISEIIQMSVEQQESIYDDDEDKVIKQGNNQNRLKRLQKSKAIRKYLTKQQCIKK